MKDKNMKQLQSIITRLDELVKDAQPGLSAWWLLLDVAIKDLQEWRETNSDLQTSQTGTP